MDSELLSYKSESNAPQLGKVDRGNFKIKHTPSVFQGLKGLFWKSVWFQRALKTISNIPIAQVNGRLLAVFF